MKKLFALLVGASLLGLTLGCSGTSSSGTGKGTHLTPTGSDTHLSGGHSGGSERDHTTGAAGNTGAGSGSTRTANTSSGLTLPTNTGKAGSGEKATGSIKLSADPTDVMVEKGKEGKFTVSVVRTSAKDDIDLKYEGADAAGVTVEGGDKIPAGKDTADVKVKAGANAKGGELTITGTEHGASTVRDSTHVKITVK